MCIFDMVWLSRSPIHRRIWRDKMTGKSGLRSGSWGRAGRSSRRMRMLGCGGAVAVIVGEDILTFACKTAGQSK